MRLPHWLRHDWGPWEDTVLLFTPYDIDSLRREMSGQKRYCRVCHRRQLKRTA